MVGLFGKKDKQPEPKDATIDLRRPGVDYSDITSRDQAKAAAEIDGRVEPFLMIGDAFGGVAEDINTLYGPTGVGAAKAQIDDEIVAAITGGGKVGLDANVEYDEVSSIPRSITFNLGPLGSRRLLFW